MTQALQTAPSELIAKHQESIVSSLSHRLEVAQSAKDFRLIELLEHERKQVMADREMQETSFLGNLQSLCQEFVHSIMEPSELQAQQIIDESGKTWWYLFDPNTGESVYADSDSESRLWIEKHYQGK